MNKAQADVEKLKERRELLAREQEARARERSSRVKNRPPGPGDFPE